MYASMALAGTLASDSADDMLKDPKLLDEHQLVIDDISEKLHDHRLFWGQTFEKKYGAIKHLCSHLEFASTLNLHSIIARLSPTSAVGTYPSALWTKYQDLLQAHTRAAYGAPFGLVMPEQTRIVVCLRGLFWDEGFLYIHVGGGITAQSDYKTEINELELKFKSTKAKLGL
jgi:isochorismate synthase EntC